MLRLAQILLPAIVILAMACFVLVNTSFSYPVPVYNDPLTAPIRVVRFTDDEITLEDGRTLKITPFRSSFADQLRDSNDRIELQTEGATTVVYASCRIFYCGTGRPPFNIPLFPYKRKVFYRDSIAYVEKSP